VLCHRFVVYTFVNGGHVLSVSGKQNAVRDLFSETLRKCLRNSVNILSPIVQVRDSVISIATRHGLDCPGIESRWGFEFFAPVQTGLGALPSLLHNGYRVFPGGKAAGAWR
jgi:hypothetical protein